MSFVTIWLVGCALGHSVYSNTSDEKLRWYLLCAKCNAPISRTRKICEDRYCEPTSCSRQNQQSQLRDICLSLLFGWWGVPWGIVYTPIQVMKNFVGICFAPNAMLPSQELEKFVRTDIANQLLAQDKTNKST
jgi:hypothetical protein